MPTEKAHGIQIMKMCEAFAKLGYSVELIIPKRRTRIKEDPFLYYDVENIFSIRRIWCLDWVKLGKIGFWIEALTFAKLATLYVFSKDGYFYTRDEIIAASFKIIRKNVIWEAHMGHMNNLIKFLIFLHTKIVVISNGLKNFYINNNATQELILVSPDAVEIEKFNVNINQKGSKAPPRAR